MQDARIGRAHTWLDIDGLVAPLYGPIQADPDELARATYNLELLADRGSVMRDVDLRPELASVTCPTLVIAGDADPWGSVHAAADIVAAPAPHVVRHEHFAGAGHHIHHDNADGLLELLREFLVAPRGATPVPHSSAALIATAPA